MSNPPTKNNLESQHFLSFSRAVQERLTNCLRSDAANIRPFSQPSESIEAIKQGLNRVQPRIPGMKKVTDSQNTFGQSMQDAVLAYKSFNGIVRTGQKLDPVVGRGTLARLDTELKNLGKPADPKPEPPAEFGSTNWRYSFFCNKGVFGKGIYTFLVISTQTQDSQQFDINELAANGNLLTGFKGETRGTFFTAKKMAAKDFDGSDCVISITRLSRTLQGTMRVQKSADSGLLDVSIALAKFRDETISLNDGNTVVRGKISGRR